MFRIELGKDTVVNIDGSSEGTQNKFFYKNMWYKTDTGEEGIVEYLISEILAFSTLKPYEYVSYDYGFINGKPGCRSKDFLQSRYELITFERIHERILGRKLSSVIRTIDGMNSKIEYVLNFFAKYLFLDVYDYLQKVFSLDYLTLNEDRHFNNLAVLSNTSENNYITAPIFDNGKSLLNGCAGYRAAFPIEYNVKRVTAKPFSGSHKAMLDYFGVGFKLDIDGAIQHLLKESKTLYRDTLIYQLNANKSIFNR